MLTHMLNSPTSRFICPPAGCRLHGAEEHWHGAGRSDLGGLLTPVGVLTPFHRNPRRGDLDVIAASLRRHGQYRPVVVNKGSITGRPDEVLAGNHTLIAARDLLQWTHLAATYVDVDNATAERIVLADNGTADAGDYDDVLLVELLETHRADLGGLGRYTEEWLDDMLAKLAGPPTLDELAALYGAAKNDDLWPRISVAVPREIRARFQLLMAEAEGEEHEKFATLLGWAEKGMA